MPDGRFGYARHLGILGTGGRSFPEVVLRQGLTHWDLRVAFV